MSSRLLLSISLFLGASLAGSGWGQEDTKKAPHSEETVRKLVQQLGSKQYQERQKAKRLLVERDDALPELKKALRSSDAEVRRLAKEAIEELDARIKKRASDRVLAHIKEVGIDYFIDEVVVRKDGLDDDGWRAILGLADALLAKAEKRSGKAIDLGRKPLDCMKIPRWKADTHDFSSCPVCRLTAERMSGVDNVGGWHPFAAICQDGIEGMASGGQIDGTLFCNGDLKYLSILSGVIVCDGDVITNECGDAVIIATGDVKVKDKTAFAALPQPPVTIVIEHAKDLMGLVKFFDTAQLGLELSAEKTAAKVDRVRAKSLFAKAGFANGDEVTAVGKTKIASREQFRRAVRRLAAQNKKTVFKVKRSDRIVELTLDFTD